MSCIGSRNIGVPTGHHLMMELFECDPVALDTPLVVERALLLAAKRADTQVLGSLIREFQPQGVTCVLIVAESHISAHTWPEYCYAAVDFFTCGVRPPQDVLDLLRVEFSANRVSHMTIRRGNELGVSLEETPSAPRWSKEYGR
ncbi:adenosylmethionine decarboxylase [Rhodococcus opacus]|uniref:adenosylmethionine decarboxylase n=1 Tax=Rhodococcus opacus TaxID=37919 RepID=UPI00247E6A83|nr:S-adenosylmethionine decarboxylase [Rhodococcus opacus]